MGISSLLQWFPPIMCLYQLVANEVVRSYIQLIQQPYDRAYRGEWTGQTLGGNLAKEKRKLKNYFSVGLAFSWCRCYFCLTVYLSHNLSDKRSLCQLALLQPFVCTPNYVNLTITWSCRKNRKNPRQFDNWWQSPRRSGLKSPTPATIVVEILILFTLMLKSKLTVYVTDFGTYKSCFLPQNYCN